MHYPVQNIVYDSIEFSVYLINFFDPPGHGRSGKRAGIKEKSMADWEKSEVEKENEAKK